MEADSPILSNTPAPIAAMQYAAMHLPPTWFNWDLPHNLAGTSLNGPRKIDQTKERKWDGILLVPLSHPS